MADNNDEWELPGKKGKRAMKEAAAAKEAEKKKREEIIKSLKDLIQGIYTDDTPVPELQTLMLTSIDGLRTMGENVSAYESYGADRLARLARKKAAANKMAANIAKVEKHFGRNNGTRFSMRKRVMTTRWLGQTMVPSNANVYADLARDVNIAVQQQEELERQRREEEQRAAEERQRWDSYYGRRHSYSTGRPQRYNYDDYGSAAQGGPSRREVPPAARTRPNNNWQSRAARGAYEEWKPPAPVEPAMYPILGVPVTASERNIKKAYREKALIYHPNKGGDPEDFKKLQKEYETALASLGAEGGRRKTRRSHHKRSKTRKNRS